MKFEGSPCSVVSHIQLLEERHQEKALLYLDRIISTAFLLGAQDFTSPKPILETLNYKSPQAIFGKMRAAQMRAARFKAPRKRALAQSIAEATNGWDGKQHFKKAVEIHDTVTSDLKKAWMKNGREGAQWTISVERLSERLKGLASD